MLEISVVLPLFNARKTISRSVLSVQSQTMKDWELIVVDDCSTDSSIAIVEELAKNDARIKILRLDSNSGAAVARNVGIREAQGRYISFLDSDDSWLPEKLEKQLNFIRKTGASFVFSAYRKVDELGRFIETMGVPKKVSYHTLLKSCVIGCLTAMYDTHVFGKVEMPLIRKRQDLGLWLKLLKFTDYAYGQNEVLAEYTVRKGSISSDKKSASYFQWKLYRDIENLSFPKASYYFIHYATRGILRNHYPSLARFLGVLD